MYIIYIYIDIYHAYVHIRLHHQAQTDMDIWNEMDGPGYHKIGRCYKLPGHISKAIDGTPQWWTSTDSCPRSADRSHQMQSSCTTLKGKNNCQPQDGEGVRGRVWCGTFKPSSPDACHRHVWPAWLRLGTRSRVHWESPCFENRWSHKKQHGVQGYFWTHWTHVLSLQSTPPWYT